MSCEATRRHLLSLERPDRPPAALRPHLAECPACREWVIGLTELEARVPYLPVPPSEAAKARLLKQLREPALVPESLRVEIPILPFTPPKERGLRKLAVAMALVAALVTVAIGLSYLQRQPDAQQEVAAAPTPAEIQKWMRELRDRRLARAETPRQKVEVLAEFADGLLTQVRQSGDLPTAERLELLATVYNETLQQEMLKHARAVSPDEQRVLLPRLAGEMGRTESEFTRLASEAPEAAAVHLRQIAATAHECDQRLRQLARDASA
jgi:hypothetical protein